MGTEHQPRSVHAYQGIPKPSGSYVDLLAGCWLPLYSRMKPDTLERFVAKVMAPSLWKTKTGKPRREAATVTLTNEGHMVEFVCLMGLLEAQLRGLVEWAPSSKKWKLLEGKS